MDDLGRTIADLVERKRAALVDSAEWCLANNALIALRYSITGAGDIIDDLDHCAETTYRRPVAASPSTERRSTILPFRTRTTVKPQQDSEELKERERRKLDPRRQDLVRRIVAGHPETKWEPKELQKLHDDWRRGGSRSPAGRSSRS